MEMEYKDPSRRGRWIVLLGVILAVGAGASAFYLINNAQQKAGTSGLKQVQGYVAALPIIARKPITPQDIALRSDIPLDATNSGQLITDAKVLVGRLLAVDVPVGQLLTQNLLASGTAGLGFAILPPTETIAPDSEAWRAVSITVADDRAVAGVLGAGMAVDVFVTANVTMPDAKAPVGPAAGTASPVATPSGDFYSDRSTKVTYQGMRILARADNFYILKVPLAVAEEISHLQADGTAQFSLALRPDQDERILDVSGLGATTSRIIERYGLPIPEHYPSLNGPIPSNPPIPALTPAPSLQPTTAVDPAVSVAPITPAPATPGASPAG